VSADGTHKQQLTTSSSDSLAPAWSPDGTRIVFERDEFWGHDIELYSIDARSGIETPLGGADWPEETPALTSGA
jgi:Tol biopolymer transport system component